MSNSATGRPAALFAAARAGEWWEYKLVPVLGVFYATGLLLHVPLWTLWPAALALFAALVPGAIYVSVINDLTDRADDATAGKRNRMAGRSPAAAAAWVAVPVLAGVGVAWWWRGNLPLLLSYLAAWTAFSLYSLPPARLKGRGLAGVLADAGGAHLFPSLIAVLLVFAQAGTAPDSAWLVVVGLWSGAYGLRGILWHQLTDRDADGAARVRTFAQRHSPERIASLARWLVFPVEAVALAALLVMLAHPLPVLALLGYTVATYLRVRWWAMTAVLVRPRPRYLLVLHDYYDVLLPLALLVASAIAHPGDAAVIAAHLLLFRGRAGEVARDLRKLIFRTLANVPRLKQTLRRVRGVFR